LSIKKNIESPVNIVSDPDEVEGVPKIEIYEEKKVKKSKGMR
jgi:hypothetical protein